MNKNSNAYIITYSIIMVVIVALVLAFASLSLQERQKANVENEMKGAILMSIGQGMDADKAKDKTAYINEQYAKYIKEAFAVKTNGDIATNDDPNYAFNLLGSLKKEYAKSMDLRELPVFVSIDGDGVKRYILPLWGSGLWGPVWGYLALESNLDTIYGVVFDHKGETPGLGAEIATPVFEGQFKGKSVFKDGALVGISVLKGAGSSAGNNHAVDAISGGTITCRGVESMIKTNMGDYVGFIKKQQEANPAAGNEPLTIIDSNE